MRYNKNKLIKSNNNKQEIQDLSESTVHKIDEIVKEIEDKGWTKKIFINPILPKYLKLR